MIDQTENIIALEQELDWLEEVINQSIASYLLQEGHENNWYDLPLPSLESTNSALAQFVNQHQLNQFERLTLALAFAPNIRPNLLDIFLEKINFTTVLSPNLGESQITSSADLSQPFKPYYLLQLRHIQLYVSI